MLKEIFLISIHSFLHSAPGPPPPPVIVLIVFPLEELIYLKATNTVVWMLIMLAGNSINCRDFLYKSYTDF